MRPLIFHIFTCLAVLGIVFSVGGKVAAEENTVTLNVADFGANGSDDVDDTNLIQKVLDASKDNGTYPLARIQSKIRWTIMIF